MPTWFEGNILEDAINSVRVADVVAERAKDYLIARIQTLRTPLCMTLPSCGNCPLAMRCQDRVGAILNGETDTVGSAFRFRAVPFCAA